MGDGEWALVMWRNLHLRGGAPLERAWTDARLAGRRRGDGRTAETGSRAGRCGEGTARGTREGTSCARVDSDARGRVDEKEGVDSQNAMGPKNGAVGETGSEGVVNRRGAASIVGREGRRRGMTTGKNGGTIRGQGERDSLECSLAPCPKDTEEPAVAQQRADGLGAGEDRRCRIGVNELMEGS